MSNNVKRQQISMPAEVGQEVMAALWNKSVALDNDCWEWQSARTRDGYGIMVLQWLSPLVKDYFLNLGNNWVVSAHRASYLANGGELNHSKPLVRHTCSNRLCINPAHLIRAHHLDTLQNRTTPRTPRVYSIDHKLEMKRRIINGDSLYSIAKDLDRDMSCVWRQKQRMITNGEYFPL